MKKLSMILASALTASAAFVAGAEEAPNRIFVNGQGGTSTGFVIDYLQDISFGRVDGEVLAKVTIDNVSLTSISLKVAWTPECKSAKLAILSQVVSDQIKDDAAMITYVNSMPSDNVPYFENSFTQGTLSGIQLTNDTKYTIVTIGIDSYGCEAGVSRTDFTTPAPPIQGDPKVEAKVLDRTLDSFTMEFTPNADVKEYWLLAGEKGTMQEQFEQFAPMFGFANFNQMIQMWGGQGRTGKQENTWTKMDPNTEYEVFVAMTDKNGNFAPYQTFEVSTLSLGGNGDASVAIELVSFTATDWDGKMLPTQAIKYSPNDQASCYRYGLYLASVYDSQKKEIEEDICSDPPVPNMAYWFQYFEGVAEYQVDVNTEYVAVAAAKNIDGKWGKMAELRFTTPATCPGYNRPASVAPASVVPFREVGATPSSLVRTGVVPSFNLNRSKITLK